MAEGCGTSSIHDGGPSVCALPVYPRAVTASLRQYMKSVNLHDQERKKQALERLKLPESMTINSNGYKTMRDAAMIELQFPNNDEKIVNDPANQGEQKQPQDCHFVKEVDVALTLSVLAALYTHPFLDGFGIFGVVKETGVDDEGLAEFHHQYFGKLPLYCDKSYSFYQALGDRKSVELPSLWSILKNLLLGGALQRINSKKITWNTKGEGITKGGLVIFDRKGKPRYAYQEDMGHDLPVEDILHALDEIRREEKKESGTADS